MQDATMQIVNHSIARKRDTMGVVRSQRRTLDSRPTKHAQPKDQRATTAARISVPPGAGPRKIPGNLPYVTSVGTLKKALEGIQVASRPDKFNADFLGNVLKLTGGGARATIPIFKRMGFLTSDGSTTDLYAKFRTDSGRGQATLLALRSAFPEIFKRSEYAFSIDDAKLKDIILEVTGLKAGDQVASLIKSTFNTIKGFIPAGVDPIADDSHIYSNDEIGSDHTIPGPDAIRNSIGLAYNINIVLPETSDLRVLNAIFRSIKENLMK